MSTTDLIQTILIVVLIIIEALREARYDLDMKIKKTEQALKENDE